MFKSLWMACMALSLIFVLFSTSAHAANEEKAALDSYASNPFATALAIASAAMSVATAANAVTAAATAVGGATEVVVTGVTVVGGATIGTVILSGIGIATVLYIGTSDLTDLFEAAQGAALAFQGR